MTVVEIENRENIDSVQIDWSNLTVTGKNGDQPVTILHDITGTTKPGELMAIMGSSGAGKSTLMNVLTKRNIKGLTISGRVQVNGVQINENISKISAYIQQNDVFVGALTVLEHLQFHARLKLSRESEVRKKERIAEVVSIMGLQKCIKTEIGVPGLTKTISGGEMKRLSIATEILVDPPIIFADEPTSGLDSYLAMSVVKTLKKLAKSGTTVLCTIHQPNSEIFEEFDSLQLLSMGRCMYNGPISDAGIFFNSVGYPCKENYNPADHYVWQTSIHEGQEEESKQKILQISDQFRKYPVFDEIKSCQLAEKSSDEIITKNRQEREKNKASTITAFIWLLWRSLISTYRDRSTVGMKFGQNMGVAVIVGLVYLRTPWNANKNPYTETDVFNINGAIFSAICSFSFSYLFLVVFAFPRIQVVLRREYYDGMYPLVAAYLAEICSGIPFLLIMPCIFISIQYCMIGLYPAVTSYLWFYVVCILIAASATGYGYMISAIAPSVEAANAIAPPLMVPLLLFGGFFLQSDTVPAYFIWLKYMSWFYYGAENLYVTQWNDGGACLGIPDMGVPGCRIQSNFTVSTDTCTSNDLSDCTCVSQEAGSQLIFQEGEKILDKFSYKPENFTRNCFCLLALAIGYRFLGYLILSFKFRKANR